MLNIHANQTKFQPDEKDKWERLSMRRHNQLWCFKLRTLWNNIKIFDDVEKVQDQLTTKMNQIRQLTKDN